MSVARRGPARGSGPGFVPVSTNYQCTECRHFARDVFSFSYPFPALTPLSRSEFYPGPGLTFLSNYEPPSPPPGPGSPCEMSIFSVPSARLPRGWVRGGGGGPEARVGERWALPIDPKMPRAPAFLAHGPRVGGRGARARHGSGAVGPMLIVIFSQARPSEGGFLATRDVEETNEMSDKKRVKEDMKQNSEQCLVI